MEVAGTETPRFEVLELVLEQGGNGMKGLSLMEWIAVKEKTYLLTRNENEKVAL